MKSCPLCGSTYADRVDFCFQDGAPLVAVAAPAADDAPASPLASVEADTASLTDVPEPRALRPREAPEPTAAPPKRQPPTAPADLPADRQAREATPQIADPIQLVDLPDEPAPDAVQGPAETLTAPETLPPPELLAAPAAFSSPTLVPDADALAEFAGDEDLPPPAPIADVAPVAALVPPAAAPGEDVGLGAEADGFLQEGAAATPPPSDEAPARKGGVPWLIVGAAAILLIGGAAVALNLNKGPAPTAPTAPAAVQPPPPPKAPEPPPKAPEPPPEPVVDPGIDPSLDGAAAPPTEVPPTEAPPTAAPASAAASGPPPATAPAPRQPTPPRNADRAAPPAPAPAPAPESSDGVWGAPQVASKGSLTISSRPSGATIYIDDKAVGRAPLSWTIDYGPHRLRAELDGYKGDARSIDVQSEQLVVPFELQPMVVMGNVNIFGTAGAQVLVDGSPIGVLPTMAKLSEGRHSFKVVQADGQTYTREHEIRFSQPGQSVSINLNP